MIFLKGVIAVELFAPRIKRGHVRFASDVHDVIVSIGGDDYGLARSGALPPQYGVLWVDHSASAPLRGLLREAYPNHHFLANGSSVLDTLPRPPRLRYRYLNLQVDDPFAALLLINTEWFTAVSVKCDDCDAIVDLVDFPRSTFDGNPPTFVHFGRDAAALRWARKLLLLARGQRTMKPRPQNATEPADPDDFFHDHLRTSGLHAAKRAKWLSAIPDAGTESGRFPRGLVAREPAPPYHI